MGNVASWPHQQTKKQKTKKPAADGSQFVKSRPDALISLPTQRNGEDHLTHLKERDDD